MSGHSKWANIKHQKARADDKRGREFTKVAKELIIAAREGGGDPEANSKLKLMVQKAKALNMPNDNIARAIKKGTGELESAAFEEMVYEGYAPGGVALMLDIATDNRNRTASEIRHLFTKNNGNLGESGCVSWMFERVGQLTVQKENIGADPDEFMLKAIEMGADDVREEDGLLEIITAPDDFMAVKEAVEKEVPIEDADIVMMPKNTVEIADPEMALRVLRLIDALEDHDDVQNVYANMSMTDEVLKSLS